jgi:hypothetical protein
VGVRISGSRGRTPRESRPGLSYAAARCCTPLIARNQCSLSDRCTCIHTPRLPAYGLPLRPVIYGDRSGEAPIFSRPPEHRFDSGTRDRGIPLDRHTLPHTLIHDVQAAQLDEVPPPTALAIAGFVSGLSSKDPMGLRLRRVTPTHRQVPLARTWLASDSGIGYRGKNCWMILPGRRGTASARGRNGRCVCGRTIGIQR